MLTNQELALLALLAEKNYYGYELEKTIEHRAMREWTELSISGIYKSLRKLETKRLVSSSRKMTTKNRLRKTYEITETGEVELRSQLKKLLAEFQQMKYPVSIGIYNLDLLPLPVAEEMLENYRSQLHSKLEEYVQVEKYLLQEGCRFNQRAVVSRQISLFKGELSWLKEFIQEIKEQK